MCALYCFLFFEAQSLRELSHVQSRSVGYFSTHNCLVLDKPQEGQVKQDLSALQKVSNITWLVLFAHRPGE